MAKIDTNVFRDLSTTKQGIPTQDSLAYDQGFSNIQVIRLKGCGSWIDYVCLEPQIPGYLEKQAAFLSTNNPIDSLLKSAINFLDVHDLATTNRIIEETARAHQASQKEARADVGKKKKKRGQKRDSNVSE